MVINDNFNNISVCYRGLGLWCLTTLSTIFQFVLEGLGLTLPNLKKINIAYTSATHATRGYLIETHQILSYKDPCVYIYVILTFDCLFDGV